MQVRQLCLEEISKIYEHYLSKEFPRSELKPFWKIRDSFLQGSYLCYGLFEGEKLYAYAFLMCEKKKPSGAMILDYLESLPGYRNQGIGGQFIQKLRSECENRSIFAEVEAPEGATLERRSLCKRRIDFYVRNGFADTGIHCKFYGVHYKLFCLQSIPRKQVHVRTMQKFYSRIYHRHFPRSKLYFWAEKHRREKRSAVL